jgi:hypothetical protein
LFADQPARTGLATGVLGVTSVFLTFIYRIFLTILIVLNKKQSKLIGCLVAPFPSPRPWSLANTSEASVSEASCPYVSKPNFGGLCDPENASLVWALPALYPWPSVGSEFP